MHSKSVEIMRQKKHVTYTTKFSVLAPITTKWSGNRPPDLLRATEIYERLKSGDFVPMLLHVADLGDGFLHCYDGNHRRTAMQMLLDTDSTDTDCIVDVIYDASHDEVVSLFMDINRSVVVPDVYVRDDIDSSVKADILELAKTYEQRYPAYLSTSRKCRRPNFNRDTFTDNITDIYRYFDATITIRDIEKALALLNKHIEDGDGPKPLSSYKANILQKCRRAGLWLFIDGRISPEQIAGVMQREFDCALVSVAEKVS